jgi:hydroxymethylpyrimidine pyrophosphatase-like HAD family hydrolase
VGGIIEVLILFDIDGTLINQEKYPENYDSIKKIISQMGKNDFTIGICTCRPLDHSVKKIFKDYGLNGPIVTECGACIYQKNVFGYKLLFTYKKQDFNINKFLKKYIFEYELKNNLKITVKISDVNSKDNETIVINKNRKMSSTIRFPKSLYTDIESIVDILKDVPELNCMNIARDQNNRLKVNVYPKYVNKIFTTENYFKNKNVVLVTDFEDVSNHSHNTLLKVYSVSSNKKFNSYCDEFFPAFGKGVEEILKKLKKGENYEKL